MVTAEEHSVIGGLGSAIAEALRGEKGQPLEFVGIQDSFGTSAYNYEELLRHYGLTADAIVDSVKQVLKTGARIRCRRQIRVRMKALMYYGPEDLRLADIADPSPAPGEALIRVKSCGICGSDVHGYLGITGRRLPPMVMGHEFAGQVAAIGAGVSDVKVGDRVAPYPVVFCMECEPCRRGDVHLCLNKRALGVLACNGAMAEYVAIPARLLFKLADHVSYDVGAMMEPLAVACRAVNHAGDLKSKSVMIVGAGAIGLLVAALVKMRGPAKLFVSDLSDSRLEVARKMGADITVNPARDDLGEIVKQHTDGRNVDVALEAVGATPTVQQAMACPEIRRHGRVDRQLGQDDHPQHAGNRHPGTQGVRDVPLFDERVCRGRAAVEQRAAVRRANDQPQSSDDGTGDRAVR